MEGYGREGNGREGEGKEYEMEGEEKGEGGRGGGGGGSDYESVLKGRLVGGLERGWILVDGGLVAILNYVGGYLRYVIRDIEMS